MWREQVVRTVKARPAWRWRVGGGVLVVLVGFAGAPASAVTAVGRTPGAFSVDASGAATYTIPIDVAPGVNGLRPSIALVYNSQAGDGPVGMRWDIAGFSSISRCNKSVEPNGVTQGVSFTNSDQFCLDGQPLMLDPANAQAVYGANGTLYRTELDSYVRVISYGVMNDGPMYFEVKQPDGRTAYYAETAATNSTNSRVPATDLGGANPPTRMWRVSQLQDKYKNSIRFAYKNATEDFNPAEIRWTDHCASPGCSSGTGDRYKLSFSYETRLIADQRSGYLNSSSWSRTKRLKEIVYHVDSAVAQSYTLDYEDPVSTGTQRSQLASVTQCGDTATGCFPATTFEWQDGVAGWNGNTAQIPELTGYQLKSLIVYGDFDGDGRTDMITRNSTQYPILPQGWQVWRATGTSFAISATQITTLAYAVVGDFNADGFDDVMAIDASQSKWVIQTSPGTLAGGSFTSTTTDIDSPTMSSPAVMDFNGDGLPDLVYVRDGVVYMRENAGCNFHTTPGCVSNPEVAATGLVEGPYYSNITYPASDGTARSADFDGDGRQDLLLQYEFNSSVHSWYAFRYAGGANWEMVGFTPSGVNAVNALTLDINGDGLSDLAYYQDNGSPGWSTMLSKGGSGGADFTAPQAIPNSYHDPAAWYAVAVDYDGDGRDDFLRENTYASVSGIAVVHLSDGAGYSSEANRIIGVALVGWNVGLKIAALDVSGDGLRDLVYAAGDYEQSGTLWRQKIKTQPVTDLITSIEDGLGNAISNIDHKPLTDSSVYTASTTEYTPSPTLSPPGNHLVHGSAVHVVSQYTMNDGVGGTYATNYHYTNDWFNVRGRGRLGFRRVEQSGGPSGSFATSTVYRQDFPFTGRVVEQALCRQPGTCSMESDALVTTQVTNWMSNGVVGPIAVRESTNVTQDYELDGSTVLRTTTRDLSGSTDWNYVLGAPNKEVIAVREGTVGPVWATTRTYTYDDSGLVAAWCLGLPTQVTEGRQNPGESQMFRQVRYDYYDSCMVHNREAGWASNPKTLKTSFAYDSFGNIESRTESDVTNPTDYRRTDYEYTDGPYHPSAEVRVVTATVYDPCGTEVLVPQSDLRTTFTWDYRLGLPAGEISPQGVEVTRTYDSFGRPKAVNQVTRGINTPINYLACDSSCFPAHSAYQVSADPTVGPSSVTYFDTYGRQVGQSTELLDGSESRAATRYNVLGQVAERDVPYLAGGTSYHVSYEYDEIGRLETETAPTGQNVNTTDPTITHYSYNGLTTTVTDAEGHQRVLVANANGTLKQVQEDPSGINAITSYQYWAFGELKKITDAGNTVNGTFAHAESNFQYDARGFMTSRSDADRGTWTFDYDAWGAPIWQNQPNGRQDFLYDAVGRLLTRTDKDSSGTLKLTTTWKYYGNAGGQTGQMQEVTTGAYHKESYSYYTSGAMLGLPQRVTTLFPEVGSSYPAFDTDYGYDGYGRLQTMTYPELWGSTRLEARYGYSATGYLANVCQASGGECFENIYAVDTAGGPVPVDALGRITHAYFGSSSSGTHEFYNYDPANLRLSSIQTIALPSQILSQDYAYQWDRVGNLAQRTRPGVGVQENFTYDPLNRLDVVTRTANSTTTTTMDLDYDPNGNITRKLADPAVPSGSDVGTYSYGTTYGGPHAVSNISGNRGGTVHYDAAGNLDCMSWSSGACNSGSSVVWTTYNLPSRIEYTSTSTYADFLYGPNRERVRTTEHVGNAMRVVYRVGPHYEVEVTWGGWSGTPDGTRFRSTIFFGDRPVYARVEDPIESSLEEGYLHKDHLGSIDRVTDVNGVTGTTSLSFDAFGKRRNIDWSNDNTDARFADDQWTERGYTGHEHFDTVQLIHMNGRVQNPIWGRMLSPDRVIGDLARPQTINPYSYVVNNPLSNTDPSGWEVKPEKPACTDSCLEKLKAEIKKASESLACRCTVYNFGSTGDFTITKWYDDSGQLTGVDVRLDAIHVNDGSGWFGFGSADYLGASSWGDGDLLDVDFSIGTDLSGAANPSNYYQHDVFDFVRSDMRKFDAKIYAREGAIGEFRGLLYDVLGVLTGGVLFEPGAFLYNKIDIYDQYVQSFSRWTDEPAGRTPSIRVEIQDWNGTVKPGYRYEGNGVYSRPNMSINGYPVE